MNNKKRVWGAVAFGLAVLALSGWKYWTGTPSYSLTQISAAVEAGDLAAFEERVDVDRVSEAAVDAMIAGLAKEAVADATGDDPVAALGVGIGLQMLEGLRGPATALLAERMRSAVTGAPPSPDSGEDRSGMLAEVARPVESMLAHAQVEGLAGLDRTGDAATAHVKIRHSDLDTTLVLDVAMEKTDTWRVVRLADPVAYLEQVEATETMRLAEVNEPIAERLASATPVGDLRAELKTRPIMWGLDYERTLYVAVPVTNATAHPISGIRLAVEGAESGNTMAFNFDRVTIAPGATRELRGRTDYSSRNPLHRALREQEYEGVAATVRGIIELREEGPDTVALYPNWTAYLARAEGK